MSHDPAAHATPHLALQLPLAGIQVIEASAGTGKTYALAGLYVRLIVERRLQVRQILVVTYTRAAADELRERLRERLVLCARLSANDDGKDASAEAQFCRDVLARAKDEGAAVLNRRLALAALSLDEAQIGTVHGFCQRVLREHAWLGGVAPLAGELLEREDELIDSLVRDLWRERAASADETGWQALRGIACSAEGLARILRALRDQHVTLQPQPARSAAALRAQLTDTSADRVLADLAAQWQAQGEAAFAALLAHLDGKHIKANIYKPDSVRQDAANFAAAFAQAQRPDRSRLERYAQSRINAPQALSKNGRALPMQAFFGAVEAACSALDEIAAAQTELGLHLLAECTAELRERLARRKRAARVYGYDDLIAGLADALAGAHGARLAAALREQFPAALIDECQDSAAREFDVFFAIYPPHAGARHLLALVGDPKQAIYRFKGGDVDAYLAARERADAQHTLAANYRSAPGLLAAIETLYAHAGAAPFVDPRIHFERVTAESGARDTDAQIDGVAAPPLTIWLAPKLTRKQDAAEYLAAGCAAEITRLLDLARQGRASLEQKQRDGARRRERLCQRRSRRSARPAARARIARSGPVARRAVDALVRTRPGSTESAARRQRFVESASRAVAAMARSMDLARHSRLGRADRPGARGGVARRCEWRAAPDQSVASGRIAAACGAAPR
jgi:exodeoxyribonuclease V beta subunit